MTGNARTVRLTVSGDIPRLMEVFADAKQTMREDGNLEQWNGSYPDEAAILRDIERGVSHVIEDNGVIVGTFAFIPGVEPTYLNIFGGKWTDDSAPYATIHRIAGARGSHGIFRTCMEWSAGQTDNIRIDTHRDNRIMQKLITAAGFTYCGIIYLADGNERLAYQRITPAAPSSL